MKNSTLQWHLARDNQVKLHKFCDKHATSRKTKMFKDTFNIVFQFDNGGSIEVELLRGTENKGYSIADHFQVVDYAWGTK